ncbi:MAG TPA: hypothetical protein VNZ47_11920 [Candidatus Dormibacteraeota bacterium]|jgi:hypothetical protein|nr:hypothetical protein [Candidatus Dormibacteraeota bacterium]
MGHIAEYKAALTPKRILELACRPDGFNVHRYRHRDENVARRAMRLVKEGKLQKTRRDSEYVYYKITEAGRQCLAQL